jgi:RNA polymerase sigma factor (TIGR02999 family)
MADVTRILNAIEQGNTQAVDKLFPLIYQELRCLAAQKMAQESPGQTLQATALVHEAYLRLVREETQNWNSRSHFFASAAEAMRRILVENARRKKSLKYGGDRKRLNLEDQNIGIEAISEDILALDEALTKLSEKDHVVSELVKLRCFAGLTLEQVANIQGISRRTAGSYWSYARAWLRREITEGNGQHSQ